jgi:hypothetical protein
VLVQSQAVFGDARPNSGFDSRDGSQSSDSSEEGRNG